MRSPTTGKFANGRTGHACVCIVSIDLNFTPPSIWTTSTLAAAASAQQEAPRNSHCYLLRCGAHPHTQYVPGTGAVGFAGQPSHILFCIGHAQSSAKPSKQCRHCRFVGTAGCGCPRPHRVTCLSKMSVLRHDHDSCALHVLQFEPHTGSCCGVMCPATVRALHAFMLTEVRLNSHDAANQSAIVPPHCQKFGSLNCGCIT